MLTILVMLAVALSGWFYAGVMAYRRDRYKKTLYKITFFLFSHVLSKLNDEEIDELVDCECEAWDVLGFNPKVEAKKVAHVRPK